MRTTLFLSTLLATALFGGTALADRTGDDNVKTHVSSARELKERIIHESAAHHEDTSTRNENKSAQKAPAAVERFRPKGDTYEHYGQGPAATGAPSSTTTQNASKLEKAPLTLTPGRSHGDTVDASSSKRPSTTGNGYQKTVGSTQFTWSAGAKNVRSFVHSTNDKGQTNNDIHGATASAMKMRAVASIIMGTAGLGLCHMSWQSSGGDSMSLFPGN